MRLQKIVTTKELAKFLQGMINTDNTEITFATGYETDENGEYIDGSPSEWWGIKWTQQFDGTCLLASMFGGGDWYVWDATYLSEIEEFEEITAELFKKIAADKVYADGIN